MTSQPEKQAGTHRGHIPRVQVSFEKKPVYFYVGLAKKFIFQNGQVQLSALGSAIASAVSVAEILKKSGLVTLQELCTSMDMLPDRETGRYVRKLKMEILLDRSDNFRPPQQKRYRRGARREGSRGEVGRDGFVA